MEAPGYSSDGIVNAFKNNFEVVNEYNWQKVVFNTSPEDMCRRLQGLAQMTRPDVIFLHIQREGILDQNTVEALRDIAFTVLYTFDCRESIQWQKDLAPYLGLVIFGDRNSVAECRGEGINNVEYLQSSCDYDLYKSNPEQIDFFDAGNGKEYIYPYGEIVFIGNNFYDSSTPFPMSKQRVEMVEFLKEVGGDKFKAYGIGWPNTRMLNPSEEIEAYRTAKVVVCHNNFRRDSYCSDRQWRAMGTGAFTICHHYQGIEKDLPQYWPVWKEFSDLRNHILSAYADDAYGSRYAGAASEIVRTHHTWDNRVKQLISLIEKHKQNGRTESINPL